MNAQKNAARSEAARFSVASGPLKSAAKSAATSARRSLAPELTPAQQRIRLVLWGSFFAVFSSVSLYYAYCRQVCTCVNKIHLCVGLILQLADSNNSAL